MPVGLKEPNPYGLYDVYGNVNEATADNYQEYSSDPKVDRYIIIPGSKNYAVRGCGSNDIPAALNSYTRIESPVGPGSPVIGFRIARNK